jgi:hypothetical protein
MIGHKLQNIVLSSPQIYSTFLLIPYRRNQLDWNIPKELIPYKAKNKITCISANPAYNKYNVTKNMWNVNAISYIVLTLTYS